MLGMKNHFDISGSIKIREVDIAGVACICYSSHFGRLPALGYYRPQANTKKILIYMYDVDVVKGYNIYQYLFGIQLFCILAKCWKLSKMQKITYFHSFLQVQCLVLAQM